MDSEIWNSYQISKASDEFMYVQVSISNNLFSFHFETLEIRGYISDHTLSHVATTRNYKHQVFNL